MSATLLATKFFIPPSKPNLVHRQRLLDRLDDSIRQGKRLTLISTPPGYGKTTLLSEWLRASKYPTAWLSLDEGDNDPVRFINYLVHALRDLKPDFGDSALRKASSSQTQITDVQLTSLVNELVDFPQETVLVLDDYHSISQQTIHDAVSYLLENSPPQVYFIIASRADPPLPISRLRGRGQVAELRQSDLRFTRQEAAGFLRVVETAQLSEGDIDSLADRTEGWIAGLQMAAASLPDQGNVSAFIQEFTGSNRFILDYLMDEVLDNQTEAIQSFLLNTSILEQICAPLTDHLLSGLIDVGTSSQAVLEDLEHKNLFIIPLDDHREWYRLHRLFADLLRQRLELQHPDRKPILHQRASNWYEENGFSEEAIEHAFSAGDHKRAAELIEASAESILMQSQVTTLRSWIRRLPSDELTARPALSVYYAWVLLWSGAPLETINAHIRISAARESHSVQALPLKAFLEINNGNVLEALRLSQLAIEQLPGDDQLLRSLACFILASCQLALGQTEDGISILEKTARTSQQAGNIMIAALILCQLADETMKHGHLRRAQQIYQQAFELAVDEDGRHLPVAGKALIGIGDLQREWNQLADAEESLTKGITWAEKWSILGSFEGYINLAMVKDAQGDHQSGDVLLWKVQDLAFQFDASEVDDYIVEMFAARRSMILGDLDAVKAWIGLRDLESSPAPPEPHASKDLLQARMWKYEQAIFARYLVAVGRHDQALELLDRLKAEAEKIDRMYLRLDTQILRAISFHVRGQKARAIEILHEALELAEPEGYVRVFVDHGGPLALLLRESLDYRSQSELHPYILKILGAFESQSTALISAARIEKTTIIEPLSDREMEVLGLLPSRLSSTEMANELSISVNTLRSHLKNIYIKLDAHSRYEAIARAKDAGLL